MGMSINLIKPMITRQNAAKKRSMGGLCEHFEPYFAAVSAASVNL